MSNNSIHAGIRQKSTVRVASICMFLSLLILAEQAATYVHDATVGFQLISAEDIDDYGVEGIVKAIRKRVGDRPVYLR